MVGLCIGADSATTTGGDAPWIGHYGLFQCWRENPTAGQSSGEG